MGKTSKEDLASIVGQRLKELRKAKTDLGQKEWSGCCGGFPNSPALRENFPGQALHPRQDLG